MNFKQCNCCAIQEITGLSYSSSALESMKEFCVLNFGKGNAPKFGGIIGKDLYSFYLFTSAVDYAGEKSAYAYGGKRLYGKEFMEFIRENELGEVWESPVTVNAAFHKDHSNQVYIWTPNSGKVRAWWESQPKPEYKPPVLTGDWRVLVLDKVGYYCVGPYTMTGQVGCRRIIQAGEVVKHLFNFDRPTRTVLCAACAGLTEAEIADANEKKVPYPPQKNGWYVEMPSPATNSFICSADLKVYPVPDCLPRFIKFKGCYKPIKQGKNAYIHFLHDSESGSILCHECLERYEKEKKDKDEQDARDLNEEAKWVVDCAVEDEYDLDEWDDEEDEVEDCEDDPEELKL